MKPRAKPASKPHDAPAAQREVGWQLRQGWRETWDSMSLAGQLKLAVIAAVTLTVMAAQFTVATFDIVATFVQSHARVSQVSTAILQHDGDRSSSEILASVQAQPSVIAATLQLPTGEVIWTFDRNAPNPDDVVSFDRAQSLTPDRAAWYERNRLDSALRQKLSFLAQPIALAASPPANSTCSSPHDPAGAWRSVISCRCRSSSPSVGCWHC